ncbi:energy-coupling factor transporter ATPase [uncultured Clostridium sp.]|uniref:ABC transporter ATP-binding protein n=1 Tax=uncultured Clostridium sp. TaxID=59620 RepID=UPI0034545A15
MVKIENVSFKYPDSENIVLNNVNLSIKKGEFITICGKSGCGKSTLLRHLKPVLMPYGIFEGKILFQNRNLKDLTNREQAEKIGYVFQSPDNQIVTDKVWHELAFGLENLGYSKEVIRLRVSEMASFFGIQDWFEKDISELSGGQKQLLNLAAIMVMEPEVLILDEPTSQLDPIAADNFLEILKKVNRDIGTTIIIAEHRLENLFTMSDKVVVMEDGKVISNGSPSFVGYELKEKKNDMFKALPTAMKVYSEIDVDGECPITIREGRKMLDKYFLDRELKVTKLEEDVVEEYKNKKVLEFKNIWFRYDKKGLDIIKDLSFSVNKGEIYSILGGNGTGKTTTLSLINRLNKPYRGTIKINDKNINNLSSKELYDSNVITLPQNPQSIFVEKTLKEDLIEVFQGKNIDKEEILEKIRAVAEFLEISNLLGMHPYDLSGGEQQRAALGKILLLEPKILLLDEPTKGIDNFFKERLGRYLKELCNKGMTVIMVSHDIEFCAKFSTRCAMFFNGSIVTTNYAKKFFVGNNFYTTAANKMSRHKFINAVTSEEVIKLCKMNQ